MSDKKKPDNAQSDEKPTGAKSTARQRHSKPSRKPVIIEAKATDIKKEEGAAAAPKSGNRNASDEGKKSSVPSTRAAKSASSNDKPANPAAGSAPVQKVDSTKSPEQESDKAKPAVAAGASGASSERPGGNTGKESQSGPSASKPARPDQSKSSAAPSGSVPAAPASNVKPKRTGAGGLLAASIVGGLIALAGAAALQYAGFLPAPGVSARLAALEDSVADVRGTTNSRIETVEARLAEAQPDAGGMTASDVESLVREQLASLPPDESAAPQLSALQERLDALAGDVQSLRDAAPSDVGAAGDTAGVEAQLQTLTARLDELENGTPDAPSGSADATPSAALSRQITALRQETDEVISQLETLRSGMDETVQANASATQRSERELQSLSAKVESLAGGLDTASQSIADNAKAIAAVSDRMANGADRRAAAALAAAALKRDIDEGTAFASSLATLRDVAPDLEGLDALDSHAAKGVPTATDLSTRFRRTISGEILDATAPAPESGAINRLFAATKSLVAVRPIGPVEGDTPSALVSQIEAALADGRLQEASQAWLKLPSAGQEASRQWHEDLQARIAADTVVDGTVRDFINSSRGG